MTKAKTVAEVVQAFMEDFADAFDALRNTVEEDVAS